MSHVESEEKNMAAKALLVSIVVVQGCLFWLMGELMFLASYQDALFDSDNNIF